MIIPLALILLMQVGPSVNLSWTPSVSPAVTSQIICRSTAPGQEDCSNPIVTFNNNTTSTYTDSNIQKGVKYYYVAEACAGTSCSIPSNEANNIPAPPSVTIKPQ